MESTVDITSFAGPVVPKPRSRILLLEDDPEFCALISAYLTEVGYGVSAVTNGIEGLKLLLDDRFDAILCDMMMPRMTGDLFYLATERVRPDLCSSFIFMTGHVSNPKIDYFIEKIGGTLLTKPFTMSAMVAAVEYVLHETRIRLALKPDYR